MSEKKDTTHRESDSALVEITRESTTEVVNKLFKELAAVAAQSKFFPNGIELIQVEVGVGRAVKIVLKISGPKPLAGVASDAQQPTVAAS